MVASYRCSTAHCAIASSATVSSRHVAKTLHLPNTLHYNAVTSWKRDHRSPHTLDFLNIYDIWIGNFPLRFFFLKENRQHSAIFRISPPSPVKDGGVRPLCSFRNSVAELRGKKWNAIGGEFDAIGAAGYRDWWCVF